MIQVDGYRIRKGETGEKTTPAILIRFHENEMGRFSKLKTIIKPANIYKEKRAGGKSVCGFQITNAEAVINGINSINVYFRTPKLEALHRAIDHLNKQRKVNLLNLPLDVTDFESNA